MKKFFIYFARLVYGKRNSNSFPRVLILLFDILIVIFSYFLLMVFKDYDHLSDMRIADSLRELIPVLIAFVGIFIATKSYRGMLRYSGFNDIVRSRASRAASVRTCWVSVLTTPAVALSSSVPS